MSTLASLVILDIFGVSPCSILSAPATAELEPLADGQVSQMDEVTMVDVSPLLTGSFCQKETLLPQAPC